MSTVQVLRRPALAQITRVNDFRWGDITVGAKLEFKSRDGSITSYTVTGILRTGYHYKTRKPGAAAASTEDLIEMVSDKGFNYVVRAAWVEMSAQWWLYRDG